MKSLKIVLLFLILIFCAVFSIGCIGGTLDGIWERYYTDNDIDYLDIWEFRGNQWRHTLVGLSTQVSSGTFILVTTNRLSLVWDGVEMNPEPYSVAGNRLTFGGERYTRVASAVPDDEPDDEENGDETDDTDTDSRGSGRRNRNNNTNNSDENNGGHNSGHNRTRNNRHGTFLSEDLIYFIGKSADEVIETLGQPSFAFNNSQSMVYTEEDADEDGLVFFLTGGIINKIVITSSEWTLCGLRTVNSISRVNSAMDTAEASRGGYFTDPETEETFYTYSFSYSEGQFSLVFTTRSEGNVISLEATEIPVWVSAHTTNEKDRGNREKDNDSSGTDDTSGTSDTYVADSSGDITKDSITEFFKSTYPRASAIQVSGPVRFMLNTSASQGESVMGYDVVVTLQSETRQYFAIEDGRLYSLSDNDDWWQPVR